MVRVRVMVGVKMKTKMCREVKSCGIVFLYVDFCDCI